VVVGGPGSTVQGAGGAGGSGAGTGAGALIDLNRADQATLETLPGVGPVMAGNIISWRTTNGPFTSVDQLQEVTGIGPSRFATLAPLVTV
jgi:competence protein ComEA